MLEVPAGMLVGEQASVETSIGATTVTAAVWEAPPSEAVMVAF